MLEIRMEKKKFRMLISIQIRSVTQSCPTLCDPMNPSMPGLPVHHQLLEFTPTHVHRVSDANQPSHPLSSPSPPASNLISGSSAFSKTSLNIWKFTVQLSHPYLTTGKNIALTRRTFVGKVMSVLFNMLSRLPAIYFTQGSVYMSMLLSPFFPLSPSAIVSTSPFSI